MKIGVEYLRYSSDRQTEQSIEGQKRVCDEFAKRNDILIVHTYIDRAMTGTNDNREAFQQMLKDSEKKEWDVVLVYKLDRFSRNKYEMAIHRKRLKDNGVKIVSAMENIPDSPEGILLESLLEGMNQYYSEELSQKTKRGMHETRLKGHFIGGNINYGYSLVDVIDQNTGKKIASKVVVDETEAPVVKEIFTDYSNGKDVEEIIRGLTERGILNRGKPFINFTLYKMLRSEKYTGIYRINGNAYDKIYPPIVPVDVYEVVRKRIEANKHGKHVPDVSYILRGLLFCGYCGRRMTSFTGTSKSGRVWRYYKCYKRKKCESKSIRKDVLENLVVDSLLKLLDTEENISTLTDTIAEVHRKKLQSDTSLQALEKELNKIKKSLANLLTAIEAGILTDTTKERLQELEHEKAVIEARILIEKEKIKEQLTQADIRKYLSKAVSQNRKRLVELLIRQITVFNDKIELLLKYKKDDTPPEQPKRGRKKRNENNPDGFISDRGFLCLEYSYTYTMKKAGRVKPGEQAHAVYKSITVQVFI